MQRLTVLASVAACLVACQATSPDEDDTSVSSAIANTMAAITGRSRVQHDLPAPSRFAGARFSRKLGLSKLKGKELRHEKKWVMPKAEAPQQLSGYLGWSSKGKKSFTTAWNTTGEKAAKSLYMRDLDGTHTQKAAPKEALVGEAVVSSAFSRQLEDDMQTGELDINLDWGQKAKAAKATKAAPKTSETRSDSNKYLDAVGWKSAEKATPPSENPYLESFSASPTKKFLAAVEASEKKDYHDDRAGSGKPHTYYDDLMPNAADEITLATLQ
jgi:hypothetical protein